LQILNKKEFKDLLIKNPNKRFVFYEYDSNNGVDYDIHITDGNLKYPGFGATTLNPEPYDEHEFIFNYDWNIDEYSDDDLFVVLSDEEVIEIANLFNSCIK